MRSYHLHTSANQPQGAEHAHAGHHCGCIGGAPALPAGSAWPTCRLCGDELVAFFDVVLPAADPAPFLAGSRLQIFACREHDDINGTIYSDYDRFSAAAAAQQLPAAYWDISDGHYLLRLLPPALPTGPGKVEPRLQQQALYAKGVADDAPGLKLLGEPDWLQDPELHSCACGAPMALLLQVPDGYAFPMQAGAPEQPDSFSATAYCLFLGNAVYVFGCTRQCNPQALWVVLQN